MPTTSPRYAISTKPGSPPVTPPSKPAQRRGNTGTTATSPITASVNDQVVGWAALSAVSERCVYGGVAENSIYIYPDHGGRGVGRTLVDALIASSEAAGIWTVQTGIFPENTASVVLPTIRVPGHRDA